MFNDKQVELAHHLFDQLKTRYPEIELAGLIEAADNPNNIWVRIVMPDDEDREIEMSEMASEISTDILLNYGYHITVFPADRPQRSAA